MLELRQKEFEASQQERQGMLILMNTMMQTMQHMTKKNMEYCFKLTKQINKQN